MIPCESRYAALAPRSRTKAKSWLDRELRMLFSVSAPNTDLHRNGPLRSLASQLILEPAFPSLRNTLGGH